MQERHLAQMTDEYQKLLTHWRALEAQILADLEKRFKLTDMEKQHVHRIIEDAMIRAKREVQNSLDKVLHLLDRHEPKNWKPLPYVYRRETND